MNIPTLFRSVMDNPLSYASRLVILLTLWAVVAGVSRVVYNLFFHPLRKFPGPLLGRATNFWRSNRILYGDLPQQVKKLHDIYGPVIRIAPHELAFIDAEAWKDIYGHHSAYEMAKDDKFYRPMGKNVSDTILSADREAHGFLRRQLSHGFSDRSMRAQEPIFREYVDLFVKRLAERADTGNSLDMRAWFNFITFDVIGNLTFGSDFGCLESAETHPWVSAITGNLKDTAMMRAIGQALPQKIVFYLFQLGVFKGRKNHVGYAKTKLQGRMESKVERPDFIEGLLKQRHVLTVDEIEQNAAVIVLAGSETTATLLCGALYLLGTHPHILDKVVQEVRSSFTSEEQIDLISVSNLSYMLACLNESFRLYPPVPVGLPRIVPKGGNKVAGHFIPQDAVVSVWQYAAYYSSRNFTRAEEFCPERFLGDPEFAKDNLSIVQPFSVGPRNCIGRNLAYAEMRLILARLLYRFDVKAAPGSEDWIGRQKIFSIWEKLELPFYLSAAVKA